MTQHCGGLVQGSYGGAGNFEMVTPALNGEGLVHYSRDNDDHPPRWGGPAGFGNRRVDGAALIQSDFGLGGRNLEVVACEDGVLVHYWRDDPSYVWYRRMTPIAGGVRGTPGFIQRPSTKRPGSASVRGNFEVVVPFAKGGLAHWWRDNRHPALVWHGPALFGIGRFDAVALTQSNFGDEENLVLPDRGSKEFHPRGNLEVVARQGERLLHFWREEGTSRWEGPIPVPIPDAVAGTPMLIQSTYGTRGDFELIVPLAGGGLAHWVRENEYDTLPWRESHRFEGGEMTLLGLVQSTFGDRGNLEVVTRVGNRLVHHSLDSTRLWAWQPPQPVAVEHIHSESEGTYSWTAAYLQEGTHVIVQIELMPDPGIHPEQLEAAKVRWRDGILHAWNCGCECRTAHSAAQAVTFDVEWVAGGDPTSRRPFDRAQGIPRHHKVSVSHHRRCATISQWGLNTSAKVVAHEFGHMLGLADEYEDPKCPNRWPVGTRTLMDVSGGSVHPRLIEHLCAPMCSQAAALSMAAAPL